MLFTASLLNGKALGGRSGISGRHQTIGEEIRSQADREVAEIQQ
jgi:hypothetical protein